MKHIKNLLFILSFFSSSYLLSEAQSLQTITPLHSDIIETTLENGLRIYLKRSQIEPGDFHLQLFAIGGKASLPPNEQPSASLATKIAWESGLADLSGDKLECSLDDHSLELNVKIEKFDRHIEATGPLTELPYCLHLIKCIFTKPQFNEIGHKQAIANMQKSLLKKNKNNRISCDQALLKVNFKNWYAIAPLTLSDLHKVDLHKCEKIFKSFFSNPTDFTLVMIGDFDPSQMIILLKQYFEPLVSSKRTQLKIPTYPSFPKGITKKEFFGIGNLKNTSTRFSFPLNTNSINPLALDLLCTIIKQKLFEDQSPEDHWKKNIKIGCRFPLFPQLSPLWLLIKVVSEATSTNAICDSIMKTLHSLKSRGISKTELKAAYHDLLKHRPHSSDNAYEISLLSCYYRAGWNVNQLYLLSELDENQENELLKKVIECYPTLDQYTLLIIHP